MVSLDEGLVRKIVVEVVDSVFGDAPDYVKRVVVERTVRYILSNKDRIAKELEPVVEKYEKILMEKGISIIREMAREYVEEQKKLLSRLTGRVRLPIGMRKKELVPI